jgi:hypothetical protein
VSVQPRLGKASSISAQFRELPHRQFLVLDRALFSRNRSHPDAPGLRMPELIFGDLFGKDNGAGGQAPVRAMFASSANAPPCNEGARGTHRAAGSLDRGDDLVSADGFPDRQREIFSHWE